MFYPQVVTSSEIKGYVQGAEGPNHYPLCGSLFAFILDAWSSSTKLKWNKTYSHKLPEAWKGILLTFLISYVSWVLAKHHDWGFLFLLVLQKKLRTWFYRMVCLKFWVDNYILTYTHCQELMMWLGSHGSLSPLFVTKMMWSMFFFCGGFQYVLSSFCVCFFGYYLYCCLSLANIMAESLHSFWTFSRSSVCTLVFILAYTHCRDLMTSVGKL